MSSSKAKKKRKKQRLRLKKKKFNLKELLKKLERDRLADLWKKLAASMAAFDNHSGTRGRHIWEDGLDLVCNKKAMKALKPYSQPFEPTTNDLNRLQHRAGDSVKSSLHSEAPTARQPTEQPFQTRPTPIQKSQFSVTSVRAPEKITSNVRCGVQSDAILVNPTVPVAPDKFSCQSSPFFKTASAASIPVLPKTLQGWSDLATVTRSFTGVSFAADQPIGGWLSPSMRRQPLVMVPPTPAAQPSPTAEEHSHTVALQQEPGSLPPEKGFASQEEKKGNKKRGHVHKKRCRRHATLYPTTGYNDHPGRLMGYTAFMNKDDSDSDTSDCDDCSSVSNEYKAVYKAVNKGDCAKVVQLCQAHPCLTTKRDEAGNSLLHYVVVQRDPQFINKFLDAVEVDKSLKNHQGATPYDLWQEYEQSVLGLYDKPQVDVGVLAGAVERGDTELIHKGFSFGISPKLYFFSYGSSLVTLLHIGVLNCQPESISAILSHVDGALVSDLLTIQDSYGLTPLELAEEESQEGDPKADEVLRLLKEGPCGVKANRALHTPTLSLLENHSMEMPQNCCKRLTELDKKLVGGITEENLLLLRDALPDICFLSSIVCRQALQQPYSEEQALFFEKMSGEGASQLQGNLRIIAEFLEACLQEGRVQSLFEFATDSVFKPGQIAACYQSEGKIYLNLTSKQIPKVDLLMIVEVVIHEMSHMASGVVSVDFCYKDVLWTTRKGQRLSRNERKIMLNNCIRLAKEAKYPLLDEALNEEQIAVITLAERLWPDSCRLSSLSQGGRLAARNADTIVVTALGLAAMSVNWAKMDTKIAEVTNENGERERKENYLLRISPNFLSEEGIREMLQMYGTTVHRAETSPPLTVFPSRTSPTKEQSLQPATTSKLAQAMASISDTLSSPKASSNTDSSTSGLLNGLLVANNRPN